MDSSNVWVIGVGMSTFCKPGTRRYIDSAKDAVTEALTDAQLNYEQIDAVVAGSVYTDSASGQRAVYQLGLTGIPVFNVNNNCSTGSSALMLARCLIQSGQYKCVMALGFEEMEGGLTIKYPKKVFPPDIHFEELDKRPGVDPDKEAVKGTDKFTSDVIRLFAHAAKDYLRQHPSAKLEDFGHIAIKNRQMGSKNQKACFHNAPVPDSDIVWKQRMLSDPITLYMSSVTADGAACAILAGDKFLHSPGCGQDARGRAVSILAQHMVTDLPSTFNGSAIEMSGFRLAERAAQKCYRETGLRPSDIDIMEVHDCFSCNEMFMYEALGLAREGEGYRLIRHGAWAPNQAGGRVFKLNNRWVVNPSGGIESKGHPIGATGLGQCYEIVTQLRNEAGIRQVDGAKIALQHNYGIGSAAVVTLYKKDNLNDFSGQAMKQSRL